MQEKNYWLTTVKKTTVDAAHPEQVDADKVNADKASGDKASADRNRHLPESVDVAIVGAGLTGLSTALFLAKRGVQVAVLEAEEFGWGASSRNGGMVLTGLKLGVPTLVSRYGTEAAHRMYRFSLASIDCVEKIISEEKIDCDFDRCGHLEVACKQQHFDDFAESAELLAREFNHQLRIVPKSDLQAEIGSDIYFGGLVDEISAGLNPARYVSGLAAAAKRAGVQMFDHARVEKIGRETNGGVRKFRVHTTKESLLASNVLLASGAYTTKTTPTLLKKVIPIGSYIIATEVLSANVAKELVPRKRMIYDSKNFLYYYRLTPDNRMLFGGRAAFFPETTNTVRQSADILQRGMIEVFPQLRDTRVEYAWGGTIDLTLDIMPHAGRIDDMFYALGFAGHGVSMATHFGEKLADIICGDPSDLPFYDIPFSDAPFGLRSGYTWALPLAEIYYRFLDVVS